MGVPGGGDGIAVGATLRAGVPHNNEGGTSGDRARAKSPTTVAEPTNENLLQDAGMAMHCIGAEVTLTLAPGGGRVGGRGVGTGTDWVRLGVARVGTDRLVGVGAGLGRAGVRKDGPEGTGHTKGIWPADCPGRPWIPNWEGCPGNWPARPHP